MGPVLYGESGDRPSVFSGRGRVTLSDGRHGRSLKRVRDDADIRATHGKASIARLDRFAEMTDAQQEIADGMARGVQVLQGSRSQPRWAAGEWIG